MGQNEWLTPFLDRICLPSGEVDMATKGESLLVIEGVPTELGFKDVYERSTHSSRSCEAWLRLTGRFDGIEVQ